MKPETRKKLYRFIKNDGITVILAGIILVLLLMFLCLRKKWDVATVIDFTIFSGIIVAMILSSLSRVFSRWLLNRLEDKVKLTADYPKLMAKYEADFYTFDNGENHKVRFPVVDYIPLTGCDIRIDDSDHMYELPAEIKERFDEIFAAHDTSSVYNQLNIRVDGWQADGNVFQIRTSRTTYFKSLVTNRAMDYPWSNGVTVREMYEYGPFLHTLATSELSNHLGFNGFVISADGYVPFVKRAAYLTVGKNTYGASVSSSLKAKYALDKEGRFSCCGLKNGILREILDELKIPSEKLVDFDCSKNLVAAYRDLVEGGKPQLVFAVRIHWSKQQIQDNFTRILKEKPKEELKVLEDGSQLLWIHKDELSAIELCPDKMVYRKKKYPMNQSTSSSLGMFIDYLKTL